MAFSNTELIAFFKQRMVELYDRNTLDSYSVRTCNTMSMFCEMKEIICGWIIGNVKRGETVGLCVDECLKLMDDEEWMDFSFYDKVKLKTHLQDYSKSVKQVKDAKDKKEKDYNEAQNTLHLVNLCIGKNDKLYLSNLLAAIRGELLTPKNDYDDNDFKPTMAKLDNKLTRIATELLRRGYSKKYLYQYFNAIKQNKGGLRFENAYDQLQRKFSAVHQHTDVVIIRLVFTTGNIPLMDNMVDTVPAEYVAAMDNSMSGYSSSASNRRFFIVKVKAQDSNAALHAARLDLAQALDRNDMGIVGIEKRGLVAYKENNAWTVHWELYNQLERRPIRQANVANPLSAEMQRIDSATNISQEIKDRLNTALRHLRVGDGQEEMEQRFLNYWIGLEFIFATPRSGDSTFARLKDKFPQMKTLYYLKRNVNDLDVLLRKKGLIGAGESFGQLADVDKTRVFNTITDMLLKYRITKMKEHLHDHSKVKEYLQSHIKHLEWHMSRIYHLRNELVHEAAIRQNIEGVANNLRSYLVFMLNLMLDYCKQQMANPQGEPAVMDNFFWHYELLWKKLTPEYEKDGFLSLGIPDELVK